MNNDFLKRIGMVSFIFLFCFLLTIFNLISIQFQFYFASYYLVLFAFVSALILVLLNSIIKIFTLKKNKDSKPKTGVVISSVYLRYIRKNTIKNIILLTCLYGISLIFFRSILFNQFCVEPYWLIISYILVFFKYIIIK